MKIIDAMHSSGYPIAVLFFAGKGIDKYISIC